MKLLTNYPHCSSYKKLKKNYKVKDLVLQLKTINLKEKHIIYFDKLKKDKIIANFIKNTLHCYLNVAEFNNIMIELFRKLKLNIDFYIPLNLFILIDNFDLNNSDNTDTENEEKEKVNKKHFICYNTLTNALNINNIYYNNKKITKKIIYLLNKDI